MARFSRGEIEQALVDLDALRAKSSAAGDWTIWGQSLTDDVAFYDEIYGAYQGRQAVTDFVVRVHAPFPNLRYEIEWAVIDVDKSEVIFQQYMILPEPDGYQGEPFAIKVWSHQRYAGDGLWSAKHDVTLSGEQAGQVFGAWAQAGGQFQAAPMPRPEAEG